MKPANLRDIRRELDAVPGDIDCLGDLQLCLALVTERAILILDSRHSDFAPGLLEEYLLAYLLLRRAEYGLMESHDSGEG
jgi:hypothetical protein